MPLKLDPFNGLACAPLFGSDTCAVDVQVAVAVVVHVAGGVYCTVIVQLPPGLTTVPDAQLPPVIVKLPVPAVCTTLGAAVSVSGAAFAPVAVLLTVIVPLRAPVTVPVTSDGVGVKEVGAIVVPITVNARPLLVPPGVVVTVVFLTPSAAGEATFTTAFTWVSEITWKLATVTLRPATVTAVVLLRAPPVSVTAMPLVPRTPEFGLIELRNGPTVNGTVLLAAPIGNVTLIFRTPSPAVAAMLSRAVMLVEEFTTKLPGTTVTPEPSPARPVAPLRFVPTRFTTRFVTLRTLLLGVIEVSVAGATVKQPVQVAVPPGVVTLTFLGPAAAVPAIVKLVVTAVGLVLVIAPAVTPEPAGSTATAVAPLRLVPLMMTGTTVPSLPEGGLTEVTVGTTGVPTP